MRNIERRLAGLPPRRANRHELPLLTPPERHQLLVEWNDTAVEYPRDRCVHELFEQQVERAPNAVAVVFEDRELTYGELNSRANQVARHLVELGVGPEVMVGLCVERSIEMVVGLLGILKAGGAYLPLDPSYPVWRLGLMLQDTAASIVLTQQHLTERLPTDSSVVICLDTEWPTMAKQSAANLARRGVARNLAYVIYTSGSTGRPKGTCIEHRSVVRLVRNTNYVELGPQEVLLQFASISFDASTFEIWGALLNGAKLVVFPPRTPSLDELGHTIEERGVTTLWLTAALFQQMVDTQRHRLRNVRQLLAGGETLSAPHVQKIIETLDDDRRLVNGYGPTENTTFTCCHVLSAGDPVGSSVPIGRPVANTTVHVLDAQLNLVPIGVAGELFTGGDGLARGYLNDPELTAAKFVPDPFSDDPDARLYRSGDLCRWRADGRLEFLGRIDHQVKLRGFRIELGEIETVLQEHPDVAQCVVTLREDRPSDQRLVAYCVPAAESELTFSDLRSHLRTRIPDYMVPSAFVALDALPLTPSGKIDRPGLPIPHDFRPDLETPYVAPRNPLEEQLATIWREVLGVRCVGVHDNFLALGGHSLLATQVVSRLKDAFGISATHQAMFEHATIAELARWLEAGRDGTAGEAGASISKVPRSGPLPLSSAQQRAWLVHQTDVTQLAYNFQAAFRFTGPLNVEALERSLNEIVSRHEIFRTTFPLVGDQPVQVIHPPKPAQLPVLDLRLADEPERDAAVRRHLNTEIHKPFDLTVLPLVRWSLLKLSETRHVMVHVEHHLVHDGWSFNVFLRELVDLYCSYSTGQSSPLPPPALQYADYAVWQRTWQVGDAAQAQLDYWQQQLADCPPLLELPYDRTRPTTPTYRGAAPRLELPAELHRALCELSQQQQVTPFMTTFAAFAVLMYRYSGQTDVCIGTGIANRNRREVEDLIGMFVNNVVLRVDLSRDPTFPQLLKQVRALTLDAAANQDIPFDQVVDAIGPTRDSRYNPLFQVMFSFHDSPMPQSSIPGLSAEVDVGISNGTAKFDLSIIGMPCTSQRMGQPPGTDDGGMTMIWEFSTDLFDASTIERMMGHFLALLEEIVADPDQKISELPLLTDPERHQLLMAWNDTAAEYPREKCVHELFEEQVQRTPNAVAVVFEDLELSYLELNHRANQLAHHLRSRGVGPESLVALCLERSPQLVIGILGVLKAGGAYVPLDADYPPQRLEFMLRDAQIELLVTQRKLLRQLPQLKCDTICLDADTAISPTSVLTDLRTDVDADQLAYVMYTSGSTGLPKGVAVTHRGITRLVIHTNYVDLSSGDSVAHLSNVSFDAATFEVWGALLRGGRLVIGSKDVALSTRLLAEFLRRHDVTTLFLTTSLFNQHVAARPDMFASLKQLLFGGESVDVSTVRKLVEHSPPGRLLHVYGPTENTTFATWELVEKVAPNASTIPIGGPISNTQVYVLDERGELLPVGVAGELYIGGAGLARGYLNRPELTAEKFVPNPFDDSPDSRLYRTGDLCRWRADGTLEFLGRLDNQVKLRGFRIELGEIEAVLNEHSDVAQSVVTLRTDQPGDKRLVAYCVPAAESDLTFSDLRSHLRTRLPDYMVPSAFVSLDAFPLTSSGKVNRRALPAPDDARPELETGYVAPRNPIEQQVASIWCDVLGVEDTGIHDNFFALGGHSLLAARVHARLVSSLQVDLPLRQLFEAPTIAELSSAIERLRRVGRGSRGVALTRVDRRRLDRLPLSFAQQRLWFLEQMEGGLTAYNVPFAWRLRGTLQLEALRRSLETIVRRHESLRTTFAMMDEQPVQVIGAVERFELPLEDLSGLAKELQSEQLDQRRQEQTERPFDLTRDLMLRACLLRLSEDEHVLLLTMHHIASDGWSLRVLWHELELVYDALCRGEDPELPDLPVQYADYAVWQGSELQGPRLERLLQYWRTQLADTNPLELPTDRPRPAVATYHGARHDFELSEELIDQLGSLTKSAGATLHMTLLAAFQALLGRYTGQDDVAVGTPIAGRSHAAVEDLIGFFVNTLVLRTDLSGNPTFRELLDRVRHVSLAAYDHQDLPFEKLVEELQPERHLSRSPLFQVMFQMLSFANEDLTLSDLAVSRLPPGNPQVVFDLEMHLWRQPKNCRGAVVYSTDLFDASTIERLVDHLVTLLEGIVADPDQEISELPLLTPPERRRLLVEWNDTAAEYPREKCVHQLFEEQVERTPEAVAVVFEDQRLTYRELNERANQVAHLLLSLQVGPDILVGLCLERSPELVIGILGILKAGGAYVPLDADCPPSRLEFMIRDANLDVLVTQNQLLGRLPATESQIVCLNTDTAQLRHLDRSNPPVNVRPNNLIYVIYTSGTTGKPKGALVEHAAVSNHLAWLLSALAIDAADNVLQKTPIYFDASVWELFAPLLCGARLTLAHPGAHRSPADLVQILREEDITVVEFVPTLLRALFEEPDLPLLKSLRLMFCGGEELTVSDQHQLFAVLPQVQLMNFYGPTEACIGSLSWQCDATWNGPRVPIGGPISNTQVYVLDERGELLPVGVAGELYIGGAGLARGYLNRPELTAEKFVPNPFDDSPDSRLYRTGDLCRWRADGTLEFLGRLDNQVKLRGFRIELGEIEAVLNEHSDVAQSVVTLRTDQPGDKRLVAYCVPAAESDLTFSDLRSHLRTRLPDYMVPSAFVSLDAFPLTSSGKVNRRALPAPDDARPELETGYVAPRNPIEQQVASIWCDVLGVEDTGIHDNFFALGGHSLLAARVHARLVSSLQVDLPLRQLFEAPTIAELSSAIERLRRVGRGPRGVALTRVDRRRLDRLPLSFAQQRLWFLEQMEGGLTAYNVPFAWRLRGTLQLEALRRSLETIVRRHESLRTTFAMMDEQPVQVIGAVERFELPLEDLSGLAKELQSEQLDQRRQEQTERPFDLTRDLMLRACLLRLSEDEHVLLLTMHHIASDGWSLRVLWHELELVYDALCRGEDPELPDLPVQYADYAVWQGSELQGPRLERLLQYWRTQLADTNPLELPTDRPRPAVATYHGARHDFELSEELIDQLGSLTKSAGATLHMTLLAAFQALLGRYTGQDDVAVGTPIAGRSHAAVEDLIGFFVNTLVLRTDLSGNPTFRELLDRVRHVSLAAYDHQDLPFEKLVEELQPERHLSRSPLFQVMFQLWSFLDKELKLRGLGVSRLPPGSQRVRFDLEMLLWQQPKNLKGAVVYSTDLFDASTIERMVGHLVTFLEGIVADPDRRISELPLLTPPERHQLLVEWNDTAVEYPRDRCVHELFEQQVERAPNAVAVVFEDRELTYGELNSRANQVARHLVELGVGPEVMVGLCVERSIEMVVGLLGILKAGGAYVPLDPSYPVWRLGLMLQDTAASIVLTQQHLTERLPTDSSVVICLDTEWPTMAKQSAANLARRGVARNLAYVIYTSGSTGRPKGTCIEHRSVVRLVRNTNYVELGPQEVLLQFASISFDASTFEIWGALLNGAKLVVFPPRTPSLDELGHTIEERGVTTLWLTAALFQQMVDTQRHRLRNVRQLLAGGETLSAPHVQKIIETLDDDRRLVNGYGPTENTTFTCCHVLSAGDPVGSSVPIGRPVANTTVHVLDAQLNLVPIGVAGELFTGGDGLARGYLNDPELTAAKFVPDPFSDDPDARLYRSGDLCRWRADGTLEFLGRIDHQVKLRGFRIELGEIETVLQEHPDVAQCVVTLREDRPSDQRLVAYCVPAANHELKVSDLKSHLRTKLPAYMVPVAFVRLDKLPLTASGKVNRGALPTPDDARPELETGYVAPRNPIEQQLASIWSELLAIDRIGVDDNFFTLGGHSLLAVRLFARIEKSFGRKLPLAVLFQHGTIGHLAQLLSESSSVSESASVLPLQPDGEGRPIFLMPGIGGALFFSRALIEELGARFPVFGIQPALDIRNLDKFRDFHATARCFVAALQEHQPHGPYALAGYSYGGLMAFEVACLLNQMGEVVDLLAVIDTGPGRRGLNPQLGERIRRLPRLVVNLAFWIREELRQFSANRLVKKTYRQSRRFLRVITSGGRSRTELDDVLDTRRIPSQNRELMQAFFAAVQDYVPTAYAGPLTLFRAKAGPLLGGYTHDLGWGRFVESLDVRQIGGRHGTILQPPYVSELARQLGDLLDDLAPCAPHAPEEPQVRGTAIHLDDV